MVQTGTKRRTETIFSRAGFGLILSGRRTRDGNNPGEEGMDIDEHGVKRYAPIYDWIHEDVLGYMEYFEIDWPLFTSGPMAFRKSVLYIYF